MIHSLEPTSRLGGLAVTAGFLLPLLSGCPGSLEGTFPALTGTGGTNGSGGVGGTAGSTVCDAPNTTFKTSCGTIGCHSAAGTGTPPDLVSAGPWDKLLSQMATQPNGGGTGQSCVGMTLVNSTRPPSGVLFKRLSGEACGYQMPFGMSPDQAAIDCITSWVNSQLPP